MTGSFVYLIVSEDCRTYVGSTVDIQRRLRQHNREITGGAKYTGTRDHWDLAAWVSGFPSWSASLQFEWRWKDLTRRQKHVNPLERRMHALKELISLERSTRSAVPYIEWEAPPEVHLETENAQSLWNAICNKETPQI
jgi:predicted GIY-YIG superfamily endonuclease